MKNESSEPLVTVVLTVYKRTKYLKIALDSVFQQTYTNYEIIVADDSNSEEIEHICNEFQRPEIRYQTHKENLGVALNIRAAIDVSKGRYIAILNDDDVWEPRFLERLVGALEQDQQRVLAFCDHWIISEMGDIDQSYSESQSIACGRSPLPEGDVADIQKLVFEFNGVPLAMGSVFRKDALNLNELTKEVVGAYDFWITCLLISLEQPVYYVAERLTRYRVHDLMETGRRSPDKNENMVFIYENLLKKEAFAKNQDRIIEGLSAWLYHVGKDRIAFNDTAGSRKYLRRSLRKKKALKTFVLLLISALPKWARVAFHFTM